MLNIVEFALARPVEHTPLFYLPLHLKGATVRIFEPGEADTITSPLWQNKTSEWHLSVRRDGVGVLTIRPIAHIASVVVSERGRRPERLRAVTHVLAKPVTHLLMGTELDAPRPIVFTAVSVLPGTHPLMRWVMASGPRRIAWK